MNKIQLTSLIILLSIYVPSQAGRWNIGASVGRAWGDAESSELNSRLSNAGISASINSIDNERTMTEIFAGYEFTPRWGAELSYVDLGEVAASINGTITGINDYFDSGRDIYPQTATGWRLSGVYRYPLGGKTQLSAEAGAFNWTTDYTLQAGTRTREVDEDGIDISYGVGVEFGQWILEGGVVGQVNWKRYTVNDETIDVLAFGVSYRF